MLDIETALKNCEIQREYARRNYPSAFEEISKRIDYFISYLKGGRKGESRELKGEGWRKHWRWLWLR